MKKFLIVGCGGSGGATLHYLMDQLRADLREHGIDEIPKAWQFLHIDVPPAPESTPGIGSIRDLGGRYRSVSSPGNSYQLVGNRVQQALAAKGELRGLLGWAPSPDAARHVGVTSGAGQYRSIGRMLTLTDLSGIRDRMEEMRTDVARADAWGDLPSAIPGEYDNSPIVPIVIASMAGGSGASMFLDVCRLLSRISTIKRDELGVFLFTPDVFAELPESMRTGVDGNALGAIGEILATQSKASDIADDELHQALGLTTEVLTGEAFARVIPIGSSIGGDGAKFGDGSARGVFRGLGRALAATMISEQASFQYTKSKVENPTPPEVDRSVLGWGVDASKFTWGSFGYASLSLGRERYSEYAAQRLARGAFDRLAEGHLDPGSQLPSKEQLDAKLDAQFETILDRLQLPRVTTDTRGWFTTHALTDAYARGEVQRATLEVVNAVSSQDAGPARAWVDTIAARLPIFQRGAAANISASAYLWATDWSVKLEEDIRREYLRAMSQLGVPYANAVVRRLRGHLDPVIERLGGVTPMAEPLVMDATVAAQAAGLRNTAIRAGHALSDAILNGFMASAREALVRESAALAAKVLASYCTDVLGALEKAGQDAVAAFDAAKRSTVSEAGLAQLKTTIYNEWPREVAPPPARFDHADNEVLLTTSADFPQRYEADVVAAVAGAATQHQAQATLVHEIVSGQWESIGARNGDFEVVVRTVGWRPPCLPRDPRAADSPTPRSVPSYELRVRTPDLLDRARENLRRPGPFADFSGQSIHEYLTQANLTPEEAQRRADEFVAKFREAMALARPLVGVNPQMVYELHKTSLQYEYSFGTIPLGDTAVATRLSAVLAEDPSLDSATLRYFESALVSSSKESRIAIFGGYPKYSPIVFSSLLDQIQKRWSGASESARHALWEWKRTRPLPASLGMSAAEQRAMVEGWFIGRAIGAVAAPATRNTTEPARVWDVGRRRWLDFPNPMLTTPPSFRSLEDWLPAVLEAHALAIVQCNGDTTLSAIAPYQALRALSDDSSQAPIGSNAQTSGERFLADWLKTGAGPSDRPSDMPQFAASQKIDQAARTALITDWLTQVADRLNEVYLTKTNSYTTSGLRAKLESPSDLAESAMIAQIAPLVLDVVEGLRSKVARAGVSGGDDDVYF